MWVVIRRWIIKVWRGGIFWWWYEFLRWSWVVEVNRRGVYLLIWINRRGWSKFWWWVEGYWIVKFGLVGGWMCWEIRWWGWEVVYMIIVFVWYSWWYIVVVGNWGRIIVIVYGCWFSW